MTDSNHRPAILIEGFSKIYGGWTGRKRLAVDGLSLEVQAGEVFGFLGPNGAGKSTTIKSLLGFLRPSAGRLEILGRPHTEIAVRHRLGYLPEVASYYGCLTPREALWMFGRIFKIARGELRRRIDAVLDRVGLLRHADDRIGTFSKGMTQRVGVAQALINDPDLLILDEPTSGLDPLGQREIRDLIAELRGHGKTVFFSSHELSAVEEVCDRVAILREGRLVRCGTLDDLLPREQGVEIAVRALDEARLLQRCQWPIQVVARRGGETTLLVDVASEMRSVVELLESIQAEIRSIERRRRRLEDVFVAAVVPQQSCGTMGGQESCGTMARDEGCGTMGGGESSGTMGREG